MYPNWHFPGCPQPGDQLDFDSLVRRYPVLKPMGDCPQDATWHAEGDVLTHTRMVCERLVESHDWQQLPATAQSIVFAAAVFHDVAKPMVTKLEDGRLRSRGHAVRGMRVVRRLLMGQAAPLACREQVAALVRHHGLPATLLDKPDPQRAVLTAAVTARCDWLAVLAAADAAGRVCLGRDDSPDRLAMFRDFCVENACGSGPYPFESAVSRVRYFRTPGSPPTQRVFDASAFEVTLMVGLPAAGKDTWLARNYDGPVVSLDEMRAEMDVDPANDQGPVVAAAKERAKELLRRRQSFAWNATNTGRPLRDGLIDLFIAYGGRVRIVYCEAEVDVMLQRNRRRSRPVPERVIEKLLDHLDVPDETEAHRVEAVTSG